MLHQSVTREFPTADYFEDLLGTGPEMERAAADGPRNGSEIAHEVTQLQTVDYHDDLLGGSPQVSALDMPMPVSIFKDVKAANVSRQCLSLRQLATQITRTKADRKDELPLVKLARFGDNPKPKKDGTPGHCLRWDENMLSASGIEGDYDAGEVSMTDAADLLQKAGIAALFYTSTHHMPTAPRWRVLCPLAEEVSRHEREALCARLNGILGGILGEESFKPSQSYYFGEAAMRDAKKGGGKAHPLETLLIEGQPLDKVAGISPIFARPKDADDFDDLLGSTTARKGQGKSGKPWSVILSALWAIPNDSGKPNWQFLCDIGMGLHEESNGSQAGFAAFDAWAKQHPSYDRRECWKIWKGLRAGQDGNIGGGTIFTEAKKHGWVEPGGTDHTLDFEDYGEEPDAELAKAKTSSRLTFLSPAECTSAPSRRYLIKGMIAEQDVACVFGAPGAGKSLLTPFLAYAVAQGREAFGMRTKPGSVFYVAAEDEHGMRGRVRALEQAHGDADQFRLVGGVANLLSADSPDLKELARAVKAQKPKLIVIDTLAMAFPGLEENSADAMGRVVAVARALTKWGAAVILVHHDTKSEGGTLKTWVNTVAGEVWRDESDGIDDADLMSRLEPIGLDRLPPEVIALTAGCDVQHDRLEVTTLGWTADDKPLVLAHEVLWGDPFGPDLWLGLSDLFGRTFQHPNGGTLRYDAALVDSGDGTTTEAVYEFTRARAGQRIFPCKGIAGFREPPTRLGNVPAKKWVRLQLVGVDSIKRRILGLATSGGFRLSDSLSATWAEQFTGERLRTRYSKGVPILEWHRLSGRRVEALDCAVYAMAARSFFRLESETRIVELSRKSAPQPPNRIIRSRYLERII